MPTWAHDAPAHLPAPISTPASRYGHLIGWKSRAGSRNRHSPARFRLVALPGQWLALALLPIPLTARDEKARMWIHIRKPRPGWLRRALSRAHILRAQTSTRPPPARTHRDLPKKVASLFPVRH